MLSLSPEIGAFLAGISLAQLPLAHDLRRRLHPLMNFFIAIFFISLGVQMELEAATAHWPAAIVLALFVIIGNPLIFMFIIARGGYSERTAFMTSVTVAQISEFSFIFAAVGLSAGLIDDSILALITVIGLITIAVSSYMILYNEGLYEWVRRRGLLRPFRAAQDDDEEPRPT
jgi:Kef-type K+ transport system membrane component KefB